MLWIFKWNATSRHYFKEVIHFFFFFLYFCVCEKNSRKYLSFECHGQVCLLAYVDWDWLHQPLHLCSYIRPSNMFLQNNWVQQSLNSWYSFISSDEHKVLKVCYCDQSVSPVRRQVSIVQRQQFDLNDNSSYTLVPIFVKSHRNVA